MSQPNKLIDVAEAKAYIEVNWPNDPVMKRIVTNLLDNLPAAVPDWISGDQAPELHLQKWTAPDGEQFQYEASAPVIGVDADGEFHEVRYESGPLFQGWIDQRNRKHKIACWIPKPPMLRST